MQKHTISMFTLYLHYIYSLYLLYSVICVFSEFIESFYNMLDVTLIEKSANDTCMNVCFDFFFLSPDNNISIFIRH